MVHTGASVAPSMVLVDGNRSVVDRGIIARQHARIPRVAERSLGTNS